MDAADFVRISKRTGKPIAICDGCGKAKNACECLERALAQQIAFRGLPAPQTQYHFMPGRKYRADFAYPEHRLLIEVEGGTRGKGGHSTHTGITRDIEKGNAAMLNGWRVLRCTSEQVTDGVCVLWIEEALKQEGATS
jgi:very-short-patch-repair endonuclease